MITNANQAVARVAYKTNEICPIYPITPASEMAELVEEWSATKELNGFGSVPTVIEMQSEAGVAGTMHGALQTGSLSTTFTASQGLLLMLPSMYKIAGELTPNVIHVATRSIATHALSVFGDHSDIMACRQSGYAFLGSSSVQEAQDFALIAQASTLASRIPFVHFFDGFRTSHEVSKIESLSNEVILNMMNFDLIDAHRDRALNPNKPLIKGSSQGPDVFFQSREATNPYYNACPEVVQNSMDEFARLTGRAYQIFEYHGHPQAEHVIISMASSTETISETINQLNLRDERFGLIKVRLFRPFSKDYLLNALPKTVKSIAVLDRTKEAGSSGEPLYLDVFQALSLAFQNREIAHLPIIVGGRYGLSSKEFNPSMVKAIFQNLQHAIPSNNFTVGIDDDITYLSLPKNNFQLDYKGFQAMFYGYKAQSNQENNSGLVSILGEENSKFIQSYTEIDYKKIQSRQVKHIRVDANPIKRPYLISNADFIACENLRFLENDNVLERIRQKGQLLVNTNLSTHEFWNALTSNTQNEIIGKKLSLNIIDLNRISAYYTIKSKNISALEVCFLSLNNSLINKIKLEDIRNFILEVDYDNMDDIQSLQTNIKKDNSLSFVEKLLNTNQRTIKVSEVPIDGTYPTDTSIFNSPKETAFLPQWNPDECIQCGVCSMACPQATLRIKVFDESVHQGAPEGFKTVPSDDYKGLSFGIQINPDQCTACNQCIDSCQEHALNFNEATKANKQHWDYFESIPEFDRVKINHLKLSQQQLQEPLFKYSTGELGCGEAPYLKLLSQLFGERLLVANATGSSSIFGGALPTTPWSKNSEGKGPAWSNSLFEDNAELGLGFRLSLDQQALRAKELLIETSHKLDPTLVSAILNSTQSTEPEIIAQTQRIKKLKDLLRGMNSQKAHELLNIVDGLIKKSVWCVGGDGWAYDIGFGGLDHVIASGKNVNILVLDNEGYANTGGQASKATPYGAKAKFNYNGKLKQKKNLGLMAMTYNNVYVASVAIGANQEQVLKAFTEADNFDGPSVIIAYCHSSSQGIDMSTPSRNHKAIVDSGQWLLYRSDPRREKRGLNKLQLDSKQPSIKIDDFFKLESRFDKLFQNNEYWDKDQLNQHQAFLLERFKKFKQMEGLQYN